MAASPRKPSALRKEQRKAGTSEEMLCTLNAVYQEKSKVRSRDETNHGGSSPSQFFEAMDKRLPKATDPPHKLQYDAVHSQKEKDFVVLQCRGL
jgi:hypothetical protein